MTVHLFSNRLEAAERLIPVLREYVDDHTILLAIPRGAVPMGFHIAKALHVPFDILLVKKIGYPGNPELAVGCVSIDGRVIDPEFAIRKEYIDRETKRLQHLLKEREVYLLGNREPLSLAEKSVIIIDDGMATGNSMLAAVQLVRQQSPAKIIVAVPVAAEGAISKLKAAVDELICLHVPEDFQAVGQFYEDFCEVSDTDVRECLSKLNSQSIDVVQPTFNHRRGEANS
ncbi:MAG: phosphoribosyltransferase [Flavobacteriales bacterium]|jgi:predicted phosphoribosyltransferase